MESIDYIISTCAFMTSTDKDMYDYLGELVQMNLAFRKKVELLILNKPPPLIENEEDILYIQILLMIDWSDVTHQMLS